MSFLKKVQAYNPADPPIKKNEPEPPTDKDGTPQMLLDLLAPFKPVDIKPNGDKGGIIFYFAKGATKVKGSFWTKTKDRYALKISVFEEQHVNFSTSFDGDEFDKVKKDVDRIIGMMK